MKPLGSRLSLVQNLAGYAITAIAGATLFGATSPSYAGFSISINTNGGNVTWTGAGGADGETQADASTSSGYPYVPTSCTAVGNSASDGGPFTFAHSSGGGPTATVTWHPDYTGEASASAIVYEGLYESVGYSWGEGETPQIASLDNEISPDNSSITEGPGPYNSFDWSEITDGGEYGSVWTPTYSGETTSFSPGSTDMNFEDCINGSADAGGGYIYGATAYPLTFSSNGTYSAGTYSISGSSITLTLSSPPYDGTWSSPTWSVSSGSYTTSTSGDSITITPTGGTQTLTVSCSATLTTSDPGIVNNILGSVSFPSVSVTI